MANYNNIHRAQFRLENMFEELYPLLMVIWSARHSKPDAQLRNGQFSLEHDICKSYGKEDDGIGSID